MSPATQAMVFNIGRRLYQSRQFHQRSDVRSGARRSACAGRKELLYGRNATAGGGKRHRPQAVAGWNWIAIVSGIIGDYSSQIYNGRRTISHSAAR
jgi:hypothetical protein